MPSTSSIVVLIATIATYFVAQAYVYPSPPKLWGAADNMNYSANTAPFVLQGYAIVGTEAQLIGKRIDLPSNPGSYPPPSDWNITLDAPPVTIAPLNASTIGVLTNDTLGAFAFDGTPLWNWTLNSSFSFEPLTNIVTTLIVDKGVAYAGSKPSGDMEIGSLFIAVDVTTGKTVWQTVTNGACNTKFSLDANHVYVATMNSDSIQALDRATGEIKWTFTWFGSEDAYVTAVVPQKNAVIAGFDNGTIEVLDASTGRRIREQPLSVKGDWILHAPEVHNNLLYILSGRYVTAVNVDKWSIQFDHLMPNRIGGWFYDDLAKEIVVCSFAQIDVVSVTTGEPSTLFHGIGQADYECKGVVPVSQDHLLAAMGGVWLVNRVTKAIRWGMIDAHTTGPIVYVQAGREIGHGIVIVPNSGSAGGWPIEALLGLHVDIAGTYFNLNTVYSPISIALSDDGQSIYTYDTNNMYGINVVAGTFNWTWQYPFMDAMQMGPGMVLNGGVLAATTEFALVVVEASNGTLVGHGALGASNGINVKKMGKQYIVYGNDDFGVVVDAAMPDQVYMEASAPQDSDTDVMYVQPVSDTHFATLLRDGEESGGALMYWDVAHVNSSTPVWNYTWKNVHVTCPPYAVGPVLITGAADNHIYAFDRGTGRVLWKTALKEPPYHAIADANGLYVLSPNYVYRVSRRSGKILWTSPQAPGLQSHPHISHGILVVRGSGIMYGFNLTQGDMLWSFQPWGGGSAPSFSANAWLQNYLFMTGMGGVLAGFDIRTGEQLFSCDTQGSVQSVLYSQGIALFNTVPTDSGDNAVFGIQIPSAFLQ